MLGFSLLARYIALRQHRRRLTAPHQRVFSSLPQDFVRNLLMVDTDRRMTAKQALEHPWMRNSAKDLAKNDLSFNQEQLRVFNATSKLRAAIKSVSFFFFFRFASWWNFVPVLGRILCLFRSRPLFDVGWPISCASQVMATRRALSS